MDVIVQNIHDAIMEGEAQQVKELTEEALRLGHSSGEIMQKGLIDGMRAVGIKFKFAQVWIPDVLMASRAMHAGLYVLKPLLTAKTTPGKGKILFGTVAGDLHDIGKNMVIMMLEGAGFEVVDIGIDVPAEGFIANVEKHQPQILCMSALLTTTMAEMNVVIEKIKEAGFRDQVKIIVGGGPVTSEFAKAIGADAYAVDAISAVEVIKNLLAEV